MSIFVTNNSDQDLKDGFGGIFYDFTIGSTIEIPEEAAKHIFGYGEQDKTSHLIRLGWLRMSNEVDRAMEKLNKFSFSMQPTKNGHSQAPVVDKVAPLTLKSVRGAKVQVV